MADSSGPETSTEPVDKKAEDKSLSVSSEDKPASANSSKTKSSPLTKHVDVRKMKECEERMRQRREQMAEEQRRKMEELRETQRQAQEAREKQQQERRKRIDEMKKRDQERRAAVEERRKKQIQNEQEKRDELLKKNHDRESRLENMKNKRGKSESLGFGSCAPRFDAGGNSLDGSKRSLSQQNLNRQSGAESSDSDGARNQRRATSACSMSRTEGLLKAQAVKHGARADRSPQSRLKLYSKSTTNLSSRRAKEPLHGSVIGLSTLAETSSAPRYYPPRHCCVDMIPVVPDFTPDLKRYRRQRPHSVAGRLPVSHLRKADSSPSPTPPRQGRSTERRAQTTSTKRSKSQDLRKSVPLPENVRKSIDRLSSPKAKPTQRDNKEREKEASTTSPVKVKHEVKPLPESVKKTVERLNKAKASPDKKLTAPKGPVKAVPVQTVKKTPSKQKESPKKTPHKEPHKETPKEKSPAPRRERTPPESPAHKQPSTAEKTPADKQQPPPIKKQDEKTTPHPKEKTTPQPKREKSQEKMTRERKEEKASTPVREKQDTEKEKSQVEEEYKAKLAEKRRQAREKAEREAELEKQRLEELRLQEEERVRQEEEEHRRMVEEQNRLAEIAKKAEEERLERAIEEEEQRKKEEAERLEAERIAKEEAEKKAKEEAERLEQERQERAKKEEEERQERRKRLEMIMKRVKTDSPETVGKETVTPDTAPPADGLKEEPKFKSPLLQNLLGRRSMPEKLSQLGSQSNQNGDTPLSVNGAGDSQGDASVIKSDSEVVAQASDVESNDIVENDQSSQVVRKDSTDEDVTSEKEIRKSSDDKDVDESEAVDISAIEKSLTNGSPEHDKLVVIDTQAPSSKQNEHFEEVIDLSSKPTDTLNSHLASTPLIAFEDESTTLIAFQDESSKKQTGIERSMHRECEAKTLDTPPLTNGLDEIYCHELNTSSELKQETCNAVEKTWREAETIMEAKHSVVQDMLEDCGIGEGDDDSESEEGQVWKMVEGAVPYTLDLV